MMVLQWQDYNILSPTVHAMITMENIQCPEYLQDLLLEDFPSDGGYPHWRRRMR